MTPRWRAPLAAAAVVALAAAVLALEVPLCPVAALTGVPCPGCGLGRATLALMRGDVGRALALHPLVLVVLPALTAGAVHVYRANETRRRHARAERLLTVAGTALLIALIGIWIARFYGAFGGPAPVARPVWAG